MIPPKLPSRLPPSDSDNFLCRIYAVPQTTPLDKVKSICQNYFKQIDTAFSDPKTHIINALKDLKVEIQSSKSIHEYDQEIQGAFNGLYLLMNHASNEKEKQNIKDEIANLKEFIHKTKFQSNTTEELINKITVLDPILGKKIKQSPQLKEIIDNTRLLFGKHRAFSDTKIEPEKEISLMEVLVKTIKIASDDKKFATALSHFLNQARKVKSENLEVLRKGHIPNPRNPSFEETSGKLNDVYTILFSDYHDRLGDHATRAVKNLFNDIIDRSLLTNTQSLSDTQRLAVHQTPDKGHEGYRTWGAKNKAARPDGYFPADSSYYLQTVGWKVLPAKESHGERWERLMGFKTPEGKNLEAKVYLELGFLGRLSDDTQRRIENFLRDYENITKTTTEWYEHKALSPAINKQISDYVEQHFSDLSTEQRAELIQEVGRFVFTAHYTFADNLLNFA